MVLSIEEVLREEELGGERRANIEGRGEPVGEEEEEEQEDDEEAEEDEEEEVVELVELEEEEVVVAVGEFERDVLRVPEVSTRTQLNVPFGKSCTSAVL